MNPERWRRIEEVFGAALARDRAARSAFLTAVCGDDSDLRREVETLLAHQEEAHPFLETPPLGNLRRLMAERDPNHLVGKRIGAYEVIELIAAGGMGTVYRAARADHQYSQRVAIKVVGQGGRAEELIERFRIERQTLAGLEHAHIARLLDGGVTEDDRPYYVMEYVEGIPIDRYCRTAGNGGLPIAERLELFCLVCTAVQYAHQNLVIHRDLKPSNILVTHDGMPKLLDFGLAKTLGGALSESDGPTADGAFLGTIAYAAPEQVSSELGGVDTRTDVYALGVILYRLMTGRAPYPAPDSLSDAIQHITKNQPPKPSVFAPQLDDELDAITLKALSKDKERRFQSAAALKEDLERYLADEPVLAKSESSWTWYRVKKTAHRYRVAFGIATAFALLVSAFAVVMTIQAGHIAHQRDIARKALQRNNIERGRAMGLSGNMVAAEELIWREFLSGSGVPASVPPDPKDQLIKPNDAYWAVWELYAHHPCLRTTWDPNNSRVTTIALSPDGTTLASSGNSGVITLFDFPSGRRRGRLADGDRPMHEEPPLPSPYYRYHPSIVFSPDGRLIAIGTSRKTVTLWNIKTGHLVSTLGQGVTDAGTGIVGLTPRTLSQHIAFSPDGGTLAMSPDEANIWLWDVASRECRHVLKGHAERVRDVCFAPDGQMLLSGAVDGVLMLWDVSTGKQLATVRGPGHIVNCVSFSPDGRLFAVGVGDDTTAELWQTASRRRIRRLAGHTAWVRTLAFHPHAPILATGSGDKAVILWDTSNGKLIRRLTGHTREINALQFSPDGQLLISADSESIKCWDLADPQCFRRLAEVGDAVFCARYSPNGRDVVYGRAHEDYSVRVCDRTTGATNHILRGHTAPVSTVAFSPDGRLIASASYDHTVRFWDPATGSCRQILSGHQNGINSISFGPDGRTLASGGDDGTIRIWEVPSGRHLATLEQRSSRIPMVCFSPDGQTLAASTGWEGAVVLWDMGSRRVRRRWKAHDVAVRAVRFSHDGRILATGGDDNLIKLWEIASGLCLGTLRGHDQDIFCLDFAPGDRVLASGGRGNSIKLWDVVQGRCLVTLDGHQDMVFSVAFGPNGSQLISASRDGVVGLWDLTYYNRHITGNLKFQTHRHADIESATANRPSPGSRPDR